jgi:formylaminopyrimidine deformylase / aminopyrimidine aminohydrolase
MHEQFSMATHDHALIRTAGPLWKDATRSRFLDALSAGSLAEDAFRRWLAQDYLFARGLLAFQAILLSKAPRDCHNPLIGGLVAIDNEMAWFESHAVRLGVDLDIAPHATCQRYSDFLTRCAYTEPYAVLLAILFGVEASYLGAWSALPAAGAYAEFIARWSSADFAMYVTVLGELTERHSHPLAQEYFNEVLVHERAFWGMAWEG